MRGGTLESSRGAGSRKGTKERGGCRSRAQGESEGYWGRGGSATERNPGAESGACSGRSAAEH